VGDATVDLAVLPPTATQVRVAQAGTDLRADTEPMVSLAHPLGVVVQVEPAQLAEAQALVADALSTLPERVRVQLVPVGAPSGADGVAPASGPLDPSTAFASLDRLVAQPSAPTITQATGELTGAGATRAVLVLTTCPGGEAPDVGSAGATAWVLAWGADCRAGAPQASAARVVDRARDAQQAQAALPALVRQVVAARSVRVVVRGPQPLVVTASGARGTVLLAAPAAAAAQPTARRADPGVGSPTLVALGGLAAVAAVLAVLLGALLRRRRAMGGPSAQQADDAAWMRLVPEWTRAHGRHEATSPVRPNLQPGTRAGAHLGVERGGNRPTGHPARPDLVIDLRHPSEAAREAPEGSA
jgi:hypothetical protein